MKFLRQATERIRGIDRSVDGAVLGRVLERAGETATELFDDHLEPGARDVRDRLLRHGASLEFASMIVRGIVKQNAQGTWAIDAAARAIGEWVKIQPSPKRRRSSREPHIFVFVGPTGAGKTTSLAKLGRKLTEAGRRVAYASLDAAGTTALERVGGPAADVDRVEVPLVTVRNRNDLVNALRRYPDIEVVLLDTPGLSPRETKSIKALSRELDRIGTLGPSDVYLTLPATKSRSAIALACDSFARLSPTGCVLTKLDETDEPTTLLESISRAKLPVAFLSDGLDTRGHLLRPTPDRFADLALRGKCR